jgi:hypothetical protein
MVQIGQHIGGGGGICVALGTCSLCGVGLVAPAAIVMIGLDLAASLVTNFRRLSALLLLSLSLLLLDVQVLL